MINQELSIVSLALAVALAPSHGELGSVSSSPASVHFFSPSSKTGSTRQEEKRGPSPQIPSHSIAPSERSATYDAPSVHQVHNVLGNTRERSATHHFLSCTSNRPRIDCLTMCVPPPEFPGPIILYHYLPFVQFPQLTVHSKKARTHSLLARIQIRIQPKTVVCSEPVRPCLRCRMDSCYSRQSMKY